MTFGRFRLDVWVAEAARGVVLDSSVHVLSADAGHDVDRLGTSRSQLEQRSNEGDIALGAMVDGDIVGLHWICSTQHRDRYLGSTSKPDDHFAYGHQLLVLPEGRGRGLATGLLVAARDLAAATWGLGLRQAVDPTNAASVGAHQRAGFRATTTISGVRIGNRTLRREHRQPVEIAASTLHTR